MQPAFNVHRAAHHRTRPGVGLQLSTGDRVVWRNPATGAVCSDLKVEFVYPQFGIVLLRGDFGRLSLRTGGAHIESRRIRIDQVALQARAAEVV